MVDPVNCTNFSRDEYALEEYAVFTICVANKPALRIAKQLDTLLKSLPGKLPFQKLQRFTMSEVQELVRTSSMGCHTMKGRGVYELVNKGLDLKTCSVDDLEEVCGIGKKTSRFFMLHSRANQQCIPLDTHILKFLRDNGVKDVPASTPSSTKKYNELEAQALRFAKKRNMTPADFDLSVWRHYSGNTPEKSHDDADQGKSLQEVHASRKTGGRGQQPVLLKTHRGSDSESSPSPAGGNRVQRPTPRHAALRRPKLPS